MRNVFIISGPSGAGEDSVIEVLTGVLPIERVITTRTRPMRPGESQGHPYYFISETEFQERLNASDFIEYAQQYNGQWAGVTRAEIERVASSGKVGIWKVEYQGVITAKRIFPEIVTILLTAPLDILEARIRRRDNPDEQLLQERMEYTREWLKHANIYDYQVENEEGKLEETVAAVKAIIEKHLVA